jgi:PAS domain-containing protein
MATQPIELILGRQFIDSLSMPVFLVDTEGTLIFYNEPAESILGIRFGETGSMKVEEWSTIFRPTDADGNPISPDKLPLVQTLTHHKPAQGSFYIDNLKGERHLINVTAIPIEGRPKRFLGAMALFWNSNFS